MPDFETVWSAASELSVRDRLRLIDELASTMPDDQPPTLSAEWMSEINRRSQEMDDGTVATESWEAVRRRMRDCIGEHDGG